MTSPRSGSPPTSDPAAEEAPVFEEGIARLESIVDRLEGGDLALEEALQAFEQGVGLARALARRLTQAEQRVDVLLREGDEARVRPLDEIPESDEGGEP